MGYTKWIWAATVTTSLTYAAALNANRVYDLLKKGASLSVAESSHLEEKLRHNAGDAEARVELLSFYASRPSGLDLIELRAARARHVSWLIENYPKDGLGLFQVATGVYRINCRG